MLASGPNSVHQALLFRQLSDDIVYFGHTMPPSEEEVERLASRNIRLVQGEVESLTIADGRLAGVKRHDCVLVDRVALVVSTRTVIRAGFLANLGLKPMPHPSGLGEYIKVDLSGATEVTGVWAAGNISEPAAQVGGSAASGAWAAARINADLVEDETRVAVHNFRKGSSSVC